MPAGEALSYSTRTARGSDIPEFVIEYDPLAWHYKANRLHEEREILVINGAVWTAKTTWATLKVLEAIQRPDPRGTGEPIWWIAGQTFQMEAFWAKLEAVAPQIGIKTRTFPWRQAEYPGGSRVHCVSAKEVDALSAHHPWLIVGDEVAKWSVEAWQFVRVRMTGARAILMSSPRPNFWTKLLADGRAGKDKRWGLIEVTSAQAGILTKAEIEAARRDLPREFFEQEYEAKIISGAGSVFRNIEARRTKPLKAPDPSRTYVITYDPAKHQDFGVVSVWDGFDQAQLYRWEKTEYLWQAEEVARLAIFWNGATVIVDANGPGEAVFELLERRGARSRNEARERRIRGDQESGEARGFSVIPVRWNNHEKGDLVMSAQVRFERGELGLIDPKYGPPYTISQEEHRAFARHRSGSGLTYTYEAPAGYHDDCVSATLLRMKGAAVPRITVTGEEAGRHGNGKELVSESGGLPRISTSRR